MVELLEKYPIRVKQWCYHEIGFVCEISDFGTGFHISNIKDPWNRIFKSIAVITDNENEIIRWECYTTIEGKSIVCMVFND